MIVEFASVGGSEAFVNGSGEVLLVGNVILYGFLSEFIRRPLNSGREVL